jgi:hypothetical protein
MQKTLYINFIIILFLSSCKEKMDAEEAAQIGITPCQKLSPFIPGTGLNQSRTAFSTSENRIKGLVLIEIPLTGADPATKKTWQHPSWKQFGWMGPIAIDENGNVFTVPIPVINVLDNPVEKQNVIYKAEGTTGEMKPFTDLPKAGSASAENVYGLLGLYYDCHAKKLYTSTVAGSTRDKENGIVYIVDPADCKIKDKLTGYDVMGLCVGGITGEKRLYFGSSRSSDIFSIGLTKSGNFAGNPRKEFSLDMLGPRGDDKARRIRFDKNGDLLIFGVEFNYNLTAPTEKQETIYRFRYDEENKKWNFVQ